MQLLASGLTIRETANRLHRSVKTVASHRLSIGRKLGVRNQVQLTLAALRLGLPVQAQNAAQPHRGDHPDLASVLLELDAATSWLHGASYLRQFIQLLANLPGVQGAHLLHIVHDRPFIVRELLVSCPQDSQAGGGQRLVQLPQWPEPWRNDGVRMWRVRHDPIIGELCGPAQSPPQWAISIGLNHPAGSILGWVVLCCRQFVLSASSLAVLLRSNAQRVAHDLQQALQAGDFREDQRPVEPTPAQPQGPVELSLDLHGSDWLLSACNKEALILTRGRLLLHIGKSAAQWMADVALLHMLQRAAAAVGVRPEQREPLTMKGAFTLLHGDSPLPSQACCRIHADGSLKLTLEP
jgi:hypothetical protein